MTDNPDPVGSGHKNFEEQCGAMEQSDLISHTR